MTYLERAMERYLDEEGYRRCRRRVCDPTNEADDWICLSLFLNSAEDVESMVRSRVAAL